MTGAALLVLPNTTTTSTSWADHRRLRLWGRRIVAKVDTLIAPLDGLEERLRAAHDTRAAFAAAAVHHLDT
jgi:hypothetical protein